MDVSFFLVYIYFGGVVVFLLNCSLAITVPSFDLRQKMRSLVWLKDIFN